MEGLRRRIAETHHDIVEDLTDSISSASRRSRPPEETTDRAFNLEQLRLAQEQVAPVFVLLANVVAVVEPIADKIAELFTAVWHALEPYNPEDLFVAVYGLFLVFFGGVYMTLVASFEAAHLFGWDRIKLACRALYVEWTKARAAFERDNKIDANRDGIADVDQMDAKDLAARRIMVLTKSVNPENVSVAIEGLTMATVAILATLRVRFAKAITLGTAIGEVLCKIFSPFTTKLLEYALPDDYEKWIPVINKYGFRYLGMSASWILMRVVTSIFAAMRGSSIFITGVCGYLVRYNYVGPNIFKEGNPMLVAAWGLLAVVGMYWQISSSFRLPFPINILLLPVTVAENFVILAVGVSAK